MSNVRLEKPAPGKISVIKNSGDDIAQRCFIFDFPIEDVLIGRIDANLVVSFEDGSEIFLENFYNEYTAKVLPEFEIDGQLFAGADFLTAFGADLMPAAGPSDSNAAVRNAAYHEYGNIDLQSGIDRLGGLDFAYSDDEDGFEGDGFIFSDGDDTLDGSDGDDTIYGRGGNGFIFGADGDDIIYGQDGDDFLDGGAGANRLYGGAGSDILVYSGNNLIMDGGSGLDFLIGFDGAKPLDSLLGSTVTNIEVIVMNNQATYLIQSLTDLNKLGISIVNSRISPDNGDWKLDTQVTAPPDYQVFEYVGGESISAELSLLVANSALI